MPSIYEMMVGANNATQQGYERGQQSKLARLYSDALQAPDQRQDALVQMARISPDAANGASGHFDKMDDNARKRLGQYAAAFSALPDDQKAQAYPQLAEMGRSLGLPVPQGEYQPQFAQGIQQLAQAFGGMGAGGNVQSTYIDAQGNRVAIMRDGTTQVLGQNAPNNQIIDTGNGFFGVNKGNLQAAPVMTGGAPQVPQQYAPAPQVTEGFDMTTLPGADIPPGDEVAMLAAAQSPGGVFVPQANGGAAPMQQQGGQLRSAPKQPAPPTQLQLNADQRDAERLRLAQEAAARAGQPSAAQQFKMEQNQRKERAMLSANDAQVDGTVKLIDGILARGKDLSGVTGIGSALSKIPGSDWADVAAMLDTLKGRSAFGALQQMRANSPTGGALGQVSERELYLLQNAETQLQSSQSPESLRRALQTYREALLESKKRMRDGVSEFYSEQAPAGGGDASRQALLDKY